MGDRPPIKFGPEWLRNLSVERGTGATTSSANVTTANSSSSNSVAANVTNTTNSSSALGPAIPRSAVLAGNVSSTTTANSSQSTTKVVLAKLRYGREEILSLYDKDTADVPRELKSNETLYQTRDKQPFALNNCEPEILNIRNSSTSSATLGDRQTSQRGRGMSVGDFRGRPRVPFTRPMSGRAHSTGSRNPEYSSTEDESGSSTSQRSWTTSNGGNSGSRGSTEQADWIASKSTYRSKRQGPSTNWRSSQSREDDEWRPMEGGRPGTSRMSRPAPGPSHSEKRDREWGERPSQEKSWGSNRRPWSGEHQTNEENLPEWALGSSSEACGGTFDSTGAFMGYNSDESQGPSKPQDTTSYSSGARQNIFSKLMHVKSAKQGSEDWWVSEKANKLSPKKFDATDLKTKKVRFQIPSTTTSEEQIDTYMQSEAAALPPDFSKPPPNIGFVKNSSKSSSQNANDDTKKDNITVKTETVVPNLPESKPFEGVRSDVEESNHEMKNFRSVMIPANNSLRQKHQNMMQPTSRESENKRTSVQSSTENSQSLNISDTPKKTPIEDGLVNELFDMALDEKEGLLGNMPLPDDNQSNLNPTLPMMVPKQELPTSSYRSRDRPNMLKKLASNTNSNIPSALILPHQQHYEAQNTVDLNNSILSSGLSNSGLTNAGMSSGLHHQGISNPVNSSSTLPNNLITNQSLGSQGLPNNDSNIQIQNSRLTNSALGSSLGLPNMQSNNNARLGMVQPSQIISPHTLLTDFQNNRRLQGITNEHESLFLGENSNNGSLQMPNSELQRSIQEQDMYAITNMSHMPHSGNPSSFTSMYSTMMPPSQPMNQMNLMEQWYYEDPEKIIQGPFTSQEMYNWYRAGFFSSSLMVKRACDAHMVPLGSYGPVVPFHPIDVSPTYPMASFETRPQNPIESIRNSQSLGMDVMSMIESPSSIDQLPYGSVNMMPNSTFNQPQMDSLWGQPSASASVPNHQMWPQQSLGINNHVNHMNMLFWGQQPQSALPSKAVLPEEIVKEMKTEDQILAQLRAAQNLSANTSTGFLIDQTTSSNSRPSSNLQEDTSNFASATPNLNELQKFIQKETSNQTTVTSKPKITTLDDIELPKMERPNVEQSVETSKSQTALTKTADVKDQKQAKQKGDTEKIAKNKENTSTKNKKKNKDEKKEESETKVKDDESKEQKRSQESSPAKGKKEEKYNNKKEIEKEKKEWVREGFTIVKGAEKSAKENKKKIDEAKAQEEADKKRKEEEKLVAEEAKAKKKQAEASKKQQDNTMQQQRQLESVMKKAPWSSLTSQAFSATDNEGLTLAEIQRLEREKKLEQMKEQQQMIQIIAQQQAAALAREQELQAGIGWAKKKAANSALPGQNLADIQAETRKATTSSSAALVHVQPVTRPESPVITNHAPWGSSQNEVLPATSIGFWDTPANQSKAADKGEKAKSSETQNKPKKKVNQNLQNKKESSPGVEFEGWCVTALSAWNAKIDVPTFIAFLKDVESPYEVKGYVKCYLGETKESTDFARQFLERRSKILRVGMVTPSDDLCKPAAAVNPRAPTAEYQEVKGKTKKGKKNKMQKVDARILGFSVTAAEDRINVGDIDTV